MKIFLKENWLLIFTIIYVLSPIDLIPEAFPAIGNLFGTVDDSILVLANALLTLKKQKAKNE
ncbi:DUF1232 domain-containing protein [Candidatus Dojkabacteria bacterium]|nr:DUF1232 domain-containing protein [Candidatus Dojkabacteria bacterium]